MPAKVVAELFADALEVHFGGFEVNESAENCHGSIRARCDQRVRSERRRQSQYRGDGPHGLLPDWVLRHGRRRLSAGRLDGTNLGAMASRWHALGGRTGSRARSREWVDDGGGALLNRKR